MPWVQVVDIGHTAVMLPLAGALAAWMLAGRAWKMALCWGAMFSAGLAAVAMSKIAYLGWQAGLPSIEFQALSGHALRATAVLPVACFLVLQGMPPAVRKAGILLGLLSGLAIGILLVHFRFHTTSEVVGSSLLGMLVSLGFIRVAAHLPSPRVNRWTAPLSILVLAGAAGLKPAAMNHRLVDVALFLSGRDRPYSWTQDRGRLRPPSPQYCEHKELTRPEDAAARHRVSRRRY